MQWGVHSVYVSTTRYDDKMDQRKTETLEKKLAINTLGTVITFTIFMILLITKMPHVWPILIFYRSSY